MLRIKKKKKRQTYLCSVYNLAEKTGVVWVVKRTICVTRMVKRL